MGTHLNICEECGNKLTHRDINEIKMKLGLCHLCAFNIHFSLLLKEWKDNLENELV